MAAIMETQFIIHSDQVTIYRIRPNPESDKTDGSDGIVLEWRDTDQEKWSNYFFIPPDCIPHIIEAMKHFVPSKV
jgi:hypothetical protein